MSTKENIRNLSFYCVYTRNHTESGTFNGVIEDLPRFVFSYIYIFDE